MQQSIFASASAAGDGTHAQKTASIAAAKLISQLAGPPDWVLAFFSANLAPEDIVNGLVHAFPKGTPLVGCSSFTEIDKAGPLTNSVSLLGARTPSLQVKTAALASSQHTSFELGQILGHHFAPFEPTLLILLPDVLTVNATQVLRGIQSVLGETFPIIGGASSDSGAFKLCYLLCDGTLQTSGVVALALKGPLQIATAARSGYMPLSIPRTATLVEKGNILLEIDHRPALDVYREFLGPRADQMPGVSVEFPIGTIPPGMDEAPALTRAVFRIDERRRALILGGDIPCGQHIRFLGASRKDVIAGAKTAVLSAQQTLNDPDFALIFTCMSRKIALGPLYEEECRGALALLPAELPKLGFYTYGELSPVGAISEHHESTFTVALLKVDKSRH